MATQNTVGPDFTGPGRVNHRGEHFIEGNSTPLKFFSMNNGASVTIASGTGALKLEWRSEEDLVGGRWGVYLAGSSAGPWYHVGELEYTGKSKTIPTFNSATTRKATKTNTPSQYDFITVSNSVMAAVDGGSFILLKIEPRDGQGMILTASELTYTS